MVWPHGMFSKPSIQNYKENKGLSPQRCWNWILELESSRLSVDLQWHQIDLCVIELDPCHVLAIRAEPDGSRVRDDLLFIDPVANSVENGAGNACRNLF